MHHFVWVIVLAVCCGLALAQNNWCQSAKCGTPSLSDIVTFTATNGSIGVMTVSTDGTYCVSRNEGASWEYRTAARPLNGFYSISANIASGGNQSIVVTANNCRAVFSTDATTFLQTIAPCVTNFIVSAVSPSGQRAAATDTYNRIWFSTNGGRSWPPSSLLWTGLRYNYFNITQMAYATDDILIAVGGYIGVNDGLPSFRAAAAHPLFLWSNDGGATISNQFIFVPAVGVSLNDISCVGLSCLMVGARTVIYSVQFSSVAADPVITQLVSPTVGLTRGLELTAVWCVSTTQCWIGGQAGYVAMTTNAGESWVTATFTNFYSAYVYSIRCADNNPNHCFFIMREGLVYTNSGVCTATPVPRIPVAGFSAGSQITPGGVSMMMTAAAVAAVLLLSVVAL